MTRIGVGVIGCGDIARVRYFPSIDGMPDLQLAGVHSRTPSAGEAMVRRYGGKNYGDLDDFLGDPAIDAVIIATPHPSHAELSVRALAADKHVLVAMGFSTSTWRRASARRRGS